MAAPVRRPEQTTDVTHRRTETASELRCENFLYWCQEGVRRPLSPSGLGIDALEFADESVAAMGAVVAAAYEPVAAQIGV